MATTSLGSAAASTVPSAPSASSVPVTLSFDLGDNQKRWVVIGISLNRLLLPVLRNFVGQEIPKHYTSLKTAHAIDAQVFGRHLTHDGPFQLNYGSINNNWGLFKRKVHSYDYKVNTAEDLAKLYLEPHMAKFTGFGNKCDLSAVLGILERASVFCASTIQPRAKDVRCEVRNKWGHCNFDEWTDGNFQNCFQIMEKMVSSLGLKPEDETKLISDLCDWKEKGLELCVGCPVDKDLMKLVRDEVGNLQLDLEAMKTSIDEVQRIGNALQDFKRKIEERVTELENLREADRREQSEKNEVFSDTIDDLSNNMLRVKVCQDEAKERISELDEKQNVLAESVAAKIDVLERKSEETDSRVKALESPLEGCSKTSPNNIAFLAPRRNSCFCGRENELHAIAANLKGNTSSCADIAICGLGGVGKTSLAIEFSWRHKNEYPGGVFWISGENNRVFQSSVMEMALEMQIATADSDFSLTLTKALSWLKKQSQLWCLVVDNHDELEMSEDMRKLLKGKWKQGARGHIIITTRREPREVKKETGIEELNCIKLTYFTQEESVEFMRKQTGKDNGEDSEIRELAAELDGLPLALHQAAAYIRYHGTFPVP